MRLLSITIDDEPITLDYPNKDPLVDVDKEESNNNTIEVDSSKASSIKLIRSKV